LKKNRAASKNILAAPAARASRGLIVLTVDQPKSAKRLRASRARRAGAATGRWPPAPAGKGQRAEQDDKQPVKPRRHLSGGAESPAGFSGWVGAVCIIFKTGYGFRRCQRS